MKKIITILSAFLIMSGIKAQKTTVQKETVKPVTDTLIKNKADSQLNKTGNNKDVKIGAAIKYAPASKVAPVSTKAGKLAPVHQ